ncbi:antibiotic biosynthesis monooxygenase family protein [Kangiella aquimarina]|uniref:Antibiotic biosynthesis monooxygenase n=1 Tax=Kangiella aquimarina TaxID=261965 RepID=A0ABZ0X5C7_9GAMM|nr:antibiotic biosynthesis monooxygenase [Kangiella aquimarina]WQG85793.1 antibiotic biosynthesis monooxygenase [Kangiella aquimarina]
MYVVIFKAKVRQFDDEYSQMAERMRELALTEFGCLEFNAVTEGDQEIALSYWPSEEHIKAWKQHPEHLAAQQLGKERWYESYSVEIAEIMRSY